MVNVLLITHRIPYPPNKGDKIRSHHLVRCLAREHRVFIASVVDNGQDLGWIEELSSQVSGVVYISIRPWWRKALALVNMVFCKPITVSYFYSKKLQEKIEDLVERESIDVVVCFSSPTAEYVFRSQFGNSGNRRYKRVMDLVDIDSYKWFQYAREARWWMSWIYGYEGRQLAKYEQRIARSFDATFVISEEERCHFSGPMAERLTVMRNGVDLEYYRPQERKRCDNGKPVLVFTGVMDYWPNVEGVRWFVDRVLPRIKAECSDVEMFIVGSNPTKEIVGLQATSGVTVTGFVNDVRPYISRAAVCVAPLRVARGIQNKVLEAMAMGKAVVATPQALEGINAENGTEIYASGTEATFAATVIMLLRDREKTEEVGRKARLCVERSFQWEQNLAPMNACLESSGDCERQYVRA